MKRSGPEVLAVLPKITAEIKGEGFFRFQELLTSLAALNQGPSDTAVIQATETVMAKTGLPDECKRRCLAMIAGMKKRAEPALPWLRTITSGGNPVLVAAAKDAISKIENVKP